MEDATALEAVGVYPRAGSNPALLIQKLCPLDKKNFFGIIKIENSKGGGGNVALCHFTMGGDFYYPSPPSSQGGEGRGGGGPSPPPLWSNCRGRRRQRGGPDSEFYVLPRPGGQSAPLG